MHKATAKHTHEQLQQNEKIPLHSIPIKDITEGSETGWLAS